MRRGASLLSFLNVQPLLDLSPLSCLNIQPLSESLHLAEKLDPTFADIAPDLAVSLQLESASMAYIGGN